MRSALYTQIAAAERVPVNAMRLCGMDRRRADATQNILAIAHRFEVGRVEADWVAAEMIEDRAFGNVTDIGFVGEPVNEVMAAIMPNLAVSALHPAALPFETAARRVQLATRHEFEREIAHQKLGL